MALVAVPSESGRGPDFSFAWGRPEFNDRRLLLREKKSAATEEASESSKRKRKRGSVSGDAVVEEKEVRVSTILLSEKCDFFRVMLTSGLRESEAGAPIVLELAEEEEAPLMELLRYIYHGSLNPELCAIEKVRDLLALLMTGDKYGCQSVQTAVWDALLSLQNFDLASSIAVVEWYNKTHCHNPEWLGLRLELHQKATDFLLKRFIDVERDWSSEEFFQLSQGSLRYLLWCDDLEAESEEDIFERLVLWVQRTQVGKERRMKVLKDMATAIRFATMSGDYLRLLLKRPLMEQLVDAIMEAVWWRASSAEQRLVQDCGFRRTTRWGITKRKRGCNEICHSFELPYVGEGEGFSLASDVAVFDGIQWVLGVDYTPSAEFQKDGLSVFLRAVGPAFSNGLQRQQARRVALQFETLHHAPPEVSEITFKKQTHTFLREGNIDEVRLENPFRQPYWCLRSSDFTVEAQLTLCVRFSTSRE